MLLFDSVKSLIQSPAELKVLQATNEDDITKAMGTLMHEISVLTYNPKALQEITKVLKLRLTVHGRRLSHKESVHILKTLTLVRYLITSGSDQFLAWVRSNLDMYECLKNVRAQAASDAPLVSQIRSMPDHIRRYIMDDELVERRRAEVAQFRASILSPGRKFTDNSHIRV